MIIHKKDDFRFHRNGWHYYSLPVGSIQVYKTSNGLIATQELNDEQMAMVKDWFNKNKYNRVAVCCFDGMKKNGK